MSNTFIVMLQRLLITRLLFFQSVYTVFKKICFCFDYTVFYTVWIGCTTLPVTKHRVIRLNKYDKLYKCRRILLHLFL